MPAGDFEAAAAVADDSVEVVAVETLDDALRALAERGGNAGEYVLDQAPVSL